jgi:Tfp pilus assembly protein PilX
MLKRPTHPSRPARSGQRGIVLVVALIVLVAITVAGMAMIRSVDTATLVAGNLAFQQSATHAADKGVEQAVAMLRQKALDNTLGTPDVTNGYSATLVALSDNPGPGQSWQEFWQSTLAPKAVDLGEDQFKNHVYYVVHRQCAAAGPPGVSGNCVESPAASASSGNDDGNDSIKLQGATAVYYRITVRVAGPRRTESYVQSYIAM